MMLIEPPSTSHRPTVCESTPGAFAISIVKWTCGFCHFHSETTPRYSTFLSMSNIANEWCAATDMDASTKPTTARPTRALVFMRTSTAMLNPRSFLDGLLRRDDRLLL